MKKKKDAGPASAGPPRRRAGPRPSARTGGGRSGQPRQPGPAPQPFAATELRQISTEIVARWFRPLQGNRLTLLEIDPWRLHAYWHVAEADLAAARARLPDGGRDAALVLRFSDLSPRTADGPPPHERFDLEVRGASNNWYVGLWRDAKHYSAELGLRAADGAFVALVRSNEVVTPRGGPSPELDFRNVEVRAPRAVQAPAAGSAVPSEVLLQDLFPQRHAPDEDYPLVAGEPSATVLDEPAFPGLPAASIAAGSGDAAGAVAEGSAAAAGEAPAMAGPDAADFPVIEAGEIEPYRALARQARAEARAQIPAQLPPLAADTVSRTGEDLEPQPLPIPSADAPVDRRGGEVASGVGEQPAGASADAGLPVPLEGVLAGAVFSFGPAAAPVYASVELVIKGRSAATGPLLLFGQPVPLEADGSFTVRLPVEHGPELAALLRHLHTRQTERGDS